MIKKIEISTYQPEEQVKKHFKLPIHYAPGSSCFELSADIVKDLELKENLDPSGVPVINYLFGSDTDTSLGHIVKDELITNYTTNVDYLTDTQTLLKQEAFTVNLSTDSETDDKNSVSSQESEEPAVEPKTKTHVDCDVKEAYNLWKEIKTDKTFKEKYHYIEWSRFDFLNKNSSFLQFLSYYNLAAPLITVIMPILILLVPFIIIQMRGHDCNFSEYYAILRVVAKKHALGKLFTNFGQMTSSEKMYALSSTIVYCFSFYQNTQVCLRFYNNMFKINKTLLVFRRFISATIARIDGFAEKIQNMATYQSFLEKMMNARESLSEILQKLEHIAEFKVSFVSSVQVGDFLKCFYEFSTEVKYNETMCYAFGLTSYFNNMEHASQLLKKGSIRCGKINTTAKTKNKEKSTGLTMKGLLYPPLVNKDAVRNNITIKKDSVITGPNASGKTTILKAMLLNIIFSQQIGCGFYKSFSLVPYRYIHCYLNVPDTSGRDSLFQSESRKCKDILQVIKTSDDSERHFCLFDELYSGTNPREAALCGTAYLLYLNQNKNVNFVLTTHYLEICKNLKKHKTVQNFKMNVNVREDRSIEYLYNIEKGVSSVDGGLEVLKQLEYPNEIIDQINEMA